MGKVYQSQSRLVISSAIRLPEGSDDSFVTEKEDTEKKGDAEM